MLGGMALQAEGAAVLVAMVATVVICSIFYVLQRRGISEIKKNLQPLRGIDPKIQYDVSRIDERLRTTCADLTELENAIRPLRGIDPKIQYDVSRIGEQLKTTCSDLTELKTELPHASEMSMMQQSMQSLSTGFSDLESRTESKMNSFTHEATEGLHRTRDEMVGQANKEIIERAAKMLGESVPRQEFESLRDKVVQLAGTYDMAERINMLASLFDSRQLKTLNWQCKLIKLLKGGLAPDAEEDLIVSEGIPTSACNKFLNKLVSEGIAERREVAAFYMSVDHEWLYSYVDNPDRLQKQLDGAVKKEKDYQEYIGANLDLVEEGLLLQSSEYRLPTGSIDFLCRDSSGRAVGLELKYPAAALRDKRQISGYRDDYKKVTGMEGARFFLVSPQIPDKLKKMLEEDKLEYREVPFG